MPTLYQVLREAVDLCFSQGRCNLSMVIATARQAHPEVFDREGDLLIDQAAGRHAKRLINKLLEMVPIPGVNMPAQLELPLAILPGAAPPFAIAVDHGTGEEVEYVRFDCATWADLQAAYREREENIRRAVAKRDDFALKMGLLGTVMTVQPAMTVGEACELLRKDTRRNGGTPQRPEPDDLL
jgi:hypothetical protein